MSAAPASKPPTSKASSPLTAKSSPPIWERVGRGSFLLTSSPHHHWPNHRRSLQRRLKDENTSHSAIIRALRIREACHLLGSSDLSLTEIGYWCGFSDSPHFSREFRRSLAMPPSVYRQTAA
ncbi:MAG: helix-turn-helix transcriptional regulator [Parvibaculum sp.]|nr:helix-turn-helix transcriptional regulator [Parvibaculum sp.]